MRFDTEKRQSPEAIATSAALAGLAATKQSFGKAEIARLAFSYWEKAGRPRGRDLEFWLQAESQLRTTSLLLELGYPVEVVSEILNEISITDLAMEVHR
jgi:hypothetical protein